MQNQDGVEKARAYYNSRGAEGFYSTFWGGEDIHIGIYDSTDQAIREASRRTVEVMSDKLELTPDDKLLDIGAGYGGSARYVAERFGCSAVCLNLSEVQNERNRRLNRKQGLQELVSVVEGNFEELPFPQESFTVVWSQDAMLHSGDRRRILREVARVLEPGGTFIFTDPMQTEDASQEELAPVLERLDLDSLATTGFYRETADSVGLRLRSFDDLSAHLPRHYGRVLRVLEENEEEALRVSGEEYVQRMKLGLANWVRAGEAGALAWGIFIFKKGA